MVRGPLAQLHMTGVPVLCRAHPCGDMRCPPRSSVAVSIYNCWSLSLSRDRVFSRCAAPDFDTAWMQLVHGFLKDTFPSGSFFSGHIVELGFSAVKVKVVALASFMFWEDAYI